MKERPSAVPGELGGEKAGREQLGSGPGHAQSGAHYELPSVQARPLRHTPEGPPSWLVGLAAPLTSHWGLAVERGVL